MSSSCVVSNMHVYLVFSSLRRVLFFLFFTALSAFFCHTHIDTLINISGAFVGFSMLPIETVTYGLQKQRPSYQLSDWMNLYIPLSHSHEHISRSLNQWYVLNNRCTSICRCWHTQYSINGMPKRQNKSTTKSLKFHTKS